MSDIDSKSEYKFRLQDKGFYPLIVGEERSSKSTLQENKNQNREILLF